MTFASFIYNNRFVLMYKAFQSSNEQHTVLTQMQLNNTEKLFSYHKSLYYHEVLKAIENKYKI